MHRCTFKYLEDLNQADDHNSDQTFKTQWGKDNMVSFFTSINRVCVILSLPIRPKTCNRPDVVLALARLLPHINLSPG